MTTRRSLTRLAGFTTKGCVQDSSQSVSHKTNAYRWLRFAGRSVSRRKKSQAVNELTGWSSAFKGKTTLNVENRKSVKRRSSFPRIPERPP